MRLKALISLLRFGQVVVPVQNSGGFDLSTEEGRGLKRYHRAGITAVSGAIARGVTVATGFVSVSLVLHYLGAERYGMWLTMSALMSVFLLGDFGIGDGLIEPLAAAIARGSRDRAQSLVSCAFFLVLALSTALLLVFGAVYPFVNWQTVFNVSSPEAIREAGPTAAAFMFCVIASFTIGVTNRVNLSLQEGAIGNMWQTAGSLLAVVSLVAATQMKSSQPILVLALSGTPLLATIANGISLFGIRRPWLRPRRALFDVRIARSLFSTSRWFLLSSLGYLCVAGTGNIVIAQTLGPELVPEFGLPARIFGVVSMAVGLVAVPLWPAYAEAIARRDNRWVRVAAQRSVAVAMLVGVAGSAAVALTGDRILRLWVGGIVHTSFAVWAGLGVASVLACIGVVLTVLLWGNGAVRFEALTRMAQAIIVLGLMMALTPRFGVAGCAWALAMSEAIRLCPLVMFVTQLVRRLRTGASPDTIQTASPSWQPQAAP